MIVIKHREHTPIRNHGMPSWNRRRAGPNPHPAPRTIFCRTPKRRKGPIAARTHVARREVPAFDALVPAAAHGLAVPLARLRGGDAAPGVARHDKKLNARSHLEPG
ncbi:MAG TPA: hypothetical protein VFP92_08120, partial [Rhodanobacteraceae bacterium]|nr:hypothetical protein [Rhodanobacteraceae bacterium]